MRSLDYAVTAMATDATTARLGHMPMATAASASATAAVSVETHTTSAACAAYAETRVAGRDVFQDDWDGNRADTTTALICVQACWDTMLVTR